MKKTFDYDKCPECGYTSSKKPNICPSCGFDLKSYRIDLKKEEIEYGKNLIYTKLINEFNNEYHPSKMDRIKNEFEDIKEYKDSKEYIKKCDEKKLDLIYYEGISLYIVEQYNNAISVFNQIINYKDSKNYIEKCKENKSQIIYNEAINCNNEKKYDQALDLFKKVEDYKDSKNYIEKCKENKSQIIYDEAINSYNGKKYDQALDLFKQIEDYKDSKKLIEEIEKIDNTNKENIYKTALQYFDSKNYIEAAKYFEKNMFYKDSLQLLHESYTQWVNFITNKIKNNELLNWMFNSILSTPEIDISSDASVELGMDLILLNIKKIIEIFQTRNINEFEKILLIKKDTLIKELMAPKTDYSSTIRNKKNDVYDIKKIVSDDFFRFNILISTMCDEAIKIYDEFEDCLKEKVVYDLIYKLHLEKASHKLLQFKGLHNEDKIRSDLNYYKNKNKILLYIEHYFVDSGVLSVLLIVLGCAIAFGLPVVTVVFAIVYGILGYDFNGIFGVLIIPEIIIGFILIKLGGVD